MGNTLGETLPKEIERVQGLITIYESIPNGIFAATMMKRDIQKAHKAIMEDDLAEMIISYEDLKGWKE